MKWLRLTLVLTVMGPVYGSVVSEVRYKISAGDLSSAEAIAEDYYRDHGPNSEYAASLAWLARGALTLGFPSAADRYLDGARQLIDGLLKTRKVEDDSFLESAAGTIIETKARLMVSRGERDQAAAFLEAELSRWKTWPIRSRIHKNLDLLTLEGKPAPELDSRYRGSPVLLFLWAHWCGDCKAQAPVIARLMQKYQERGLKIVAPTRRYGSIPNNEHPTPDQEDQEIERVWKESYAALAGIPHPVSEPAMLRYGVSSTPTLVLIDRNGIVRMYRPVRVTEAELSRRIETLLAP
ncbi:MAG: TlpA disulfide reductase family protein [Bryobacteraceae bacterium]